MRLAAGPGDGLALQRHHPQVVGQLSAADHRVQPPRPSLVLGRDAGRILPILKVVVKTGRRAELAVLVVESGIVVAQRDQRRSADRAGVGAHCQRLGHVGAGANTTGDDQLHLAVHLQLIEGFHRLAQSRQGGITDVLDKDVLRRAGATLHAVEDHHVGASLDRQ